MTNTTKWRPGPLSLLRKLAVVAVMALIVALTAVPASAEGHSDSEASTASLTLSASEAEAGDTVTVTVTGSGFRVGTEASFIYTSTITVGGLPVADVTGVDTSTSFLHAGRTTDSGLYIAEHIDIDPADATADGAFSADIVLPDLPAGDHYVVMTSCWGGPDDAYPQDGVAPCGTEGLGGGVNDCTVRARITVSATLSVEYTVRAGDSLWKIAAVHYGSGHEWPRICEASKGVMQADGRMLTDPNLIVTGWTLILPN